VIQISAVQADVNNPPRSPASLPQRSRLRNPGDFAHCR